MRTELALSATQSTKTIRRNLQKPEENFGSILTDIARYLYPPPKTAAQIAAVVGCSERNAELCLSGKQQWSGDAVAVFVTEILHRHKMRNVKIVSRE